MGSQPRPASQRGCVAMSGDTQGSPNLGRLGAASIEWVEPRDTAQCPIMYKAAPTERMTRQPPGSMVLRSRNCSSSLGFTNLRSLMILCVSKNPREPSLKLPPPWQKRNQDHLLLVGGIEEMGIKTCVTEDGQQRAELCRDLLVEHPLPSMARHLCILPGLAWAQPPLLRTLAAPYPLNDRE